MSDYDVLFIGAGHNALVCAGYLAQAGYRVALLERRPVVGGAVVTEEVIPGFHFDLGGSAHILIHHTPIVQDLGLAGYGLTYLDLDPLFFAPFPDGSHIFVWRSVERTCEGLAAISPAAADSYHCFVETWRPVARAILDAFLHPPTPLNLSRYLAFGSLAGARSPERLSSLLRGYGQLLRESFSDTRLQATIGWLAAQSGPSPAELFSAPLAIWHPLYHLSGIRRPRGGSGMLTQALARMIQAHGGDVYTSAPVRRILVRGGRAVGVETDTGERLTARAVVATPNVHLTLQLLPEGSIPVRAHRLLSRARIGNGLGMVVRYAMRDLPAYAALASPPAGQPGPQHVALQLLCPDLEYLQRAYADYLARRPSQRPALVAMTFSAVDPTLAPPGHHVLFLWGQYYPYEREDGQSWDDAGPQEADRMLSTLARYAPNVQEAVVGRLIETPLYLGRTLGLLRGNIMHLEMSVDQMFLLRPALTLASYRGPLPGLYLTGASTHPGGGIMGAAGRNAAAVLLRDLSRRPWAFWKRL